MPNVSYGATIAWDSTYGGSNTGSRRGITKAHDSVLVMSGPSWHACPLLHHDDQGNLFVV